MLKNVEKMDRLLNVEASIANIYQKLLQLEKEGKKNSEIYKENFAYLDLIHPIEHRLVKEIYVEIGIEDILGIFSDIVERDIMMDVLSFSNMFDVKRRIVFLFVDYFFKEAVDTNLMDEGNITNRSKIDFIYEQVILKNLIALTNIDSEENVYKEEYMTLKYNCIYTYANLLDNMFETDFATEKDIEQLCFIYHLSQKEIEKTIRTLCISEAQLSLEEWRLLVRCRNVGIHIQTGQISPEFALQFMYDRIGACLMGVDESSFGYLQQYLEELDINACEKASMYFLLNKIKDSKSCLEQKNKHLFVKENLLFKVEFYQ